MKDLLQTIVQSFHGKDNLNKNVKLQAVDYMDDGSKISLCVDINGQEVQ